MYEDYRYSETQTIEKIKTQGFYIPTKDRVRHPQEFIEFEYQSKSVDLPISSTTANKIREWKDFGSSICVEVSFKKGLKNSFIVYDYKVETCK